MIEQKKLKFEILRDPGNEIAEAYGLRWTFPDDLKKLYLQFGINLAANNGESSWTLPLPARFIVDKAGVVQYASVDPDYTRRPEPRETLEALKGFMK
jgi:peroxiredoxin